MPQATVVLAAESETDGPHLKQHRSAAEELRHLPWGPLGLVGVDAT